ncbi:Non-reducing end alpha-L-arabinofuranosidase BoGH43B [subsurface metagenome]
MVNGNGTIEMTLPAPKLPQHPFKEPPARDDFDDDELALPWNFLRNPYEGDFSLTARPGYLCLNGSAVTLNDQDSPAFVGRRQTDFDCVASTLLEFDPNSENEEAGLVLRGFDKFHYEIGVTLRQGKRQVFFRKVLKGETIKPVQYVDVHPGPVILSVKASPLSYEFSCQSSTGAREVLGTALTKDLSVEKIGFAHGMCFTGVYFGMYATGNGQKSTSPADFDWFEYNRRKNESKEQ